MSETDSFKKLTGNGILLSQGLWEIEAIFKETDCGDTYSPADNEPVASSGLIFINLNTSSIPVSFPEGTDGYLNISSYTLSSVPDSITNLDVDVSLYSYNEATSSFSSSSIDIPVDPDETGKSFSTTDEIALDSGLYYAKVTVTGTVSSSQKTLFTDVIGFSIRGGLTTVVKGVCSHYNISTTSSVVIVPPSKPNGTNTEYDIKNFYSENFEDGTTYQLSENYTMIPNNGSFYNKVIDSNKSVAIDLNGYALNNVQGDQKCYFTVKENSTLSIINSNTKKNPTISKSSEAGVNNASFVVDGGTLNVGSQESGSVVLKGTPASEELINADTTEVHAPIEISQNGGTVNLCGNSKENEITIEDCVKGIAGVVGKKIDSDLNINIILDYVAIKSKGANEIPNYGIYLDGQGRNGTIEIKVGQIGDKKNISTSDSSGNGIYGYGIYITNFSGKIKITIDDGGSIESSDGYGIYITDTCTGSITITNNGTVKAGSKGQAALYVRGKTEKENKDGELLKETFTYSQTTAQGS